MNEKIKEYLKTITTTGLANGGQLLAEQADKFLDLTLEYSTLLKTVHTEGKSRKSGEIDSLNIGGVCTTPATETPDPPTSGEKTDPTFGKIPYLLKKLRSAFDMSSEALLDNIESDMRLGGTLPGKQSQDGTPPGQGDFRDTLMKAYAKRMATDFELLAIQGDESLEYAIPGSPTMLEKLLHYNNGWLKVLLDASNHHIVDAGYKNISIKLFADMLSALPSPYLKNPADLRWYVGPRLNIAWVSKLAERQTALGDDVLKGMGVAPFGIPMEMVPLLPEDKVVGTNESLGHIVLTYPENLIYVYRRNVEMYWEFKPRGDLWENTTYTENDSLIENVDASVLATNVKVDSGSLYGA